MPTGYTADVENGKVADLRTFVLSCARAFGACVMQRDDDMHDPPKLRKVGPYYPDALAKARKRYAELLNMSAENAVEAAEADYRAALVRHNEAENRQATENARYQTMLDKVAAWTPPSPEHQGLKEFMVQQLRDSVHDWHPEPPVLLSGEVWLDQRLEQASKGIAYYTKNLREEQERTNNANVWIQQLYNSLDGVTV